MNNNNKHSNQNKSTICSNNSNTNIVTEDKENRTTDNTNYNVDNLTPINPNTKNKILTVDINLASSSTFDGVHSEQKLVTTSKKPYISHTKTNSMSNKSIYNVNVQTSVCLPLPNCKKTNSISSNALVQVGINNYKKPIMDKIDRLVKNPIKPYKKPLILTQNNKINTENIEIVNNTINTNNTKTNKLSKRRLSNLSSIDLDKYKIIDMINERENKNGNTNNTNINNNTNTNSNTNNTNINTTTNSKVNHNKTSSVGKVSMKTTLRNSVILQNDKEINMNNNRNGNYYNIKTNAGNNINYLNNVKAGKFARRASACAENSRKFELTKNTKETKITDNKIAQNVINLNSNVEHHMQPTLDTSNDYLITANNVNNANTNILNIKTNKVFQVNKILTNNDNQNLRCSYIKPKTKPELSSNNLSNLKPTKPTIKTLVKKYSVNL